MRALERGDVDIKDWKVVEIFEKEPTKHAMLDERWSIKCCDKQNNTLHATTRANEPYHKIPIKVFFGESHHQLQV